MKIKELSSFLESLAPLSSQENYDNSGLLVGNPNDEVEKALISLDCTEEIVQEAIDTGCQIVISHHPIVFGGLKKLNGKNYVERAVIKAIKNNIALYAIHTNLDNYRWGVNYKMSQLLGLKNEKILSPKENVLNKLVTYVPIDHRENVLNALFDAGAGHIGNYSECSFSVLGEGTFKASENANPFVGAIGERHTEHEARIEVVFGTHIRNTIFQALKTAHPYEEVAYEIYPILNSNQEEGAGMIGELENSMSEEEFLTLLKKTFGCQIIRHTALRNKPVKKVALCGGSGGFLLGKAKNLGADFFVTADYKYHEFFDAEGQIVIADIGHYESEQYTTNLLADILTKKFPKFALHLTVINTNPIKYF